MVIGSYVSDVYKDLMVNSGLGNDFDNREKESGGNIFNCLIDIIFFIFILFLGVMVGVGVLKGFLILVVIMGWLVDILGVYFVFFLIVDGLFIFLLIMLVFMAVKKFNINFFLVVVLVMVLVYFSIIVLVGKIISFVGFLVIIGLSGYIFLVLLIILVVFV